MKMVSRRDFLRGIGAVGAAVALESVASRVPLEQEQASNDTPMVDMLGPEYLECLSVSAWAIEHCEPQSVFIVGSQGLLLVSPDGGKTWTKM